MSKTEKLEESSINLYAISSTIVFPMHVAPPSTRAETTGDVREAASWVVDQSKLPNPVINPLISNLGVKIGNFLT